MTSSIHRQYFLLFKGRSFQHRPPSHGDQQKTYAGFECYVRQVKTTTATPWHLPTHTATSLQRHRLMCANIRHWDVASHQDTRPSMTSNIAPSKPSIGYIGPVLSPMRSSPWGPTSQAFVQCWHGYVMRRCDDHPTRGIYQFNQPSANWRRPRCRPHNL